MKTAYPLPQTLAEWDAWEKSLQSGQQDRTVHTVGTFYHEDIYHESGYPPSPMEELNADLIAFEAAWERLVRALPESLMWIASVLVWAWLMMEFVG